MVAAHRAIRILAQLQLPKTHPPGVEQKQPVNHYVRRAQDDLDRFVRLNRADNTGQHAEHSTFRAGRHQTRRWWFRIKATIARAAFSPKDAGLAFKTKDRTVNVRLAGQHAGIIHQIARGKIICAVDDHVVVYKQTQSVLAGQSGLVRFDLDVWIDVFDAIASRSNFWPPNVFRAVNDLAL